MNSAVSDAVLIGLDWGTSSLRAYLIGADGVVLDQVSTDNGIMNVEDRAFDPVFHDLVRPWTGEWALPVVASGMITSRNGWVETPYLSVPAGSGDLARALVAHRTSDGSTLHFATGMTTEHDGAPDVMRGEETQIVGAAAMGLGDGTYVMPGTHSKWVTVRDGQIADYTTYMTGEVFAALRAHTILGTLMEDGPFAPAGFDAGAASGLASGADLLHRLFHTRTLPLFGKISAQETSDYLSGLLIGAEVKAGAQALPARSQVTIVGRGDLADRYARALAQAGLQSRNAPEDVVARGLYEIAKSAGLTS